MQYVLFKLGHEEYALDVQRVQEIVQPDAFTKLPNTPEFIEGVINLRGRVMPVLNLSTKFGLEAIEDCAKTRLVVLNIGDNEEKQIAIKVDEVTEVRNIAWESVEQTVGFIGENIMLQGIAKLEERLVILINLEKVLDLDEYQVIVSQMVD